MRIYLVVLGSDRTSIDLKKNAQLGKSGDVVTVMDQARPLTPRQTLKDCILLEMDEAGTFEDLKAKYIEPKVTLGVLISKRLRNINLAAKLSIEDLALAHLGVSVEVTPADFVEKK